MVSSDRITVCRPASGISASPKRATLLVLLTDTPVPAVRKSHGTYHDVFSSLFQRSLDAHPLDLELTVKSFDVVNEPWEYPSEQDLSESSGLLITGSAASAYETKPWINRLVEYTAALPCIAPHIKVIGICYGHQIVARAYGAVVEKNVKGWELGVRTVQLNELGQKLLLADGDRRSSMTIHQVHQDHVPALPEGFAGLGSTSVCAIQGMVSPATAQTLGDIRIFTLQGHPEFSPDIVTEIIKVREEKGILTKEFADESRENAKLHDEGLSLGSMILKILMSR